MHPDSTSGRLVLSSQAILDALYPLPDPLRSAEECDRYAHQDLGDLSLDELILERRQVEWRLSFDKAPAAWLAERLAAIDSAISNA